MTEVVDLPELPSGSRDEQAVDAAAALTTEQHLARFYVELQAWIDDGRPVPSKFTPSMGLCGNLDGWCAHEDDDSICLNELLEDLDNSFAEAGLHDLYPFNNRGDRDYTDERRAGGLYRNPARLAWIKAHAESAGGPQ